MRLVADQVLEIFRRHLPEAPELRADDDPFVHGLDSLRAEAIIADVSVAAGVELPLYLLLDHPSASAMAAAIAAG